MPARQKIKVVMGANNKSMTAAAMLDTHSEGHVMTMPDMASQLLDYYRQNKPKLIIQSIGKLRNNQNATNPFLNLIALELLRKYTNTQDKKEKEDIIGVLRYLKDDIDPNYEIGDSEKITLLASAFGSNALEFARLLVKETKIKVEINKGSERQRAADCICVSLAKDKYPMPERLQLLELFLECKPRITPKNFRLIIGNCDLIIIERYINTGLDIFYFDESNPEENVLSESIKRLLHPLKLIAEKKHSNEIEKTAALEKLKNEEQKVIKILNYFLGLMEKQKEKSALAQKIKNHAFIEAAALGNANFLEILFKAGADPLFRNPVARDGVDNALAMSIVCGQFRACHSLLTIFKSLDKTKAEAIQLLKNRALIVAVVTHQPAMVLLLLENGANPNYFDESLQPALNEAILQLIMYDEECSRKRAEIQRQAAGVTSSEVITSPKTKEANPLNLSVAEAIKNTKAIITHLLNKKYNADPNLRPNNFLPSLMLATEFGDRGIISELITAGAKPDLPSQGFTILHLAAFFHPELIPFCAKIVPDSTFYIQNNGVFSALYLVIRNCDLSTIRYCFTEHPKLDINKSVVLNSAEDPLSALMVGVLSNKPEKVRLLLALGADVTQVFQNKDGTHRYTVFNFAPEGEIFKILLAAKLYKDLNIQAPQNAATQNTQFDPVTNFVNHVSEFKPYVDVNGALLLEISRLPFEYIKAFKVENTKIMMPQVQLIKTIKNIECFYNTENRTLTLKEILEPTITATPEYQIFQKETLNQPFFESAKAIAFDGTNLYQTFLNETKKCSDTLNVCDELCEEAIESITAMEKAVAAALPALPSVAAATASNTAVGIESDKEKFSRKKITSFQQALGGYRTALNEQQKDTQDYYHANQALLNEVSAVTELVDLDLDKFKVAEEIVRILQGKLKAVEELFRKIAQLQTEIRKDHTKIESLRGRHERHAAKVSTKAQLGKEKENNAQKLLEQKLKEEQLALKAEAERNEKIRAEILTKKAVWRQEQEKLKKEREASFDRVDTARKEAQAQTQNMRKGLDDMQNVLLLSKPLRKEKEDTKPKTASNLTLAEHFPLTLQAGVGDELEQLSSALKVLNVEPIEHSKENNEMVTVEIEFVRRTLLGLLARIMEHFVQRGLSPGLKVNIAEHFRNLVFHGNFFPEVSDKNTLEAIRWNSQIKEMATRLLNFLSSKTPLKTQTWDEVSRAIGSPLFNQMVSTEVKEKAEKAFYEAVIKKEKELLAKFERYEANGGLYTHLVEAPIILQNSFGFTYGILGASVAGLKRCAIGSYNKHKIEYDGYREKGKNYRHVKKVVQQDTGNQMQTNNATVTATDQEKVSITNSAKKKAVNFKKFK